MKISAYYKDRGDDVSLVDNWLFDASSYDIICMSKVFTDTELPLNIESALYTTGYLGRTPLAYGGTGFFFDKAPALPPEIEHIKPDYNLYSAFVTNDLKYKFYRDYSIGFLTRGCFRKCKFCVNQKYDHVFKASPLIEFLDSSRKKLCFLDDNFFGFPDWRNEFEQIQATGKRFVFKQGLDERLLTDEKCKLLFSSKYDGDFIFAFDNINDYALINEKLKIISKYKGHKPVKFYVLVGFNDTTTFDIENAFKRIELLFQYGCIPYIMRYQSATSKPWKTSINSGVYTQLARWSNQPAFVKKLSFREFCEKSGGKAKRDMEEFALREPCVASRYFDIRFKEC